MLKDPDILDGEKGALVLDFDRALGLMLDVKDARAEIALPGPLSALLEERKEARGRKDWKRSDEIRDLLKEKGFGVKDNPDGTTSWFPI
jgi:cysteinyl-tRNA synthetase